MATIDLTSSTLVASFPGLNRANGTDQLDLVATLVDTTGAALEGSTVEFMVSPVFRGDVVGATTESPAGTYTAAFTTSDASIKKVSLLVDGVEVGLTAQVEFVEFDDSFLVDDPFTENVGQLSGDLTLAGQQITLKAEANNSGAITEIIWNGQQLLNVLNKDRGLQTKVVKDNFGTTNWAQLNEAGALRQAWADDSSSRYIGDAQDLRSLVTQTFLSYREPVEFAGLSLDCSGDILTKHIGMDYLGNPNIFRIDFQNDQYASNKLGATSWAVSLGLTQNFTRFYTFAPTATVTEPTEQALTSGNEVLNTTYMGGPIVTTDDGNLALGIFRPVRSEGAELLSSFVRPQSTEAGAAKFTDNYCQLIDFEDSAADGGLAMGKHRMERFICIGTLQAVTNAFRELQYFLTTGLQNPGDPGDPPPPPTQTVDSIAITSAPATVTRGATFSVGLRAIDFTGATVTDYNGSVVVSATSALGLTNSGSASRTFVNGELDFTDLALTGSGTGDLTFTTSTPEGVAVGQHTIGVENEVPVISSVTPNTATDNLNGVDIRVEGAGFVSGSTIFFGGTSLSTTLNSEAGIPDYLTATIPGANLVESSVPYLITVQNPAPGGGTSSTLPFLVTDGTAPEVVANTPTVNASGTGATLTWQTDEPSVTRIYWGPVGQLTTELVITDPNGGLPLSTSHLVNLAGLIDLTDYEATIGTEDEFGNRNNDAGSLSWQVGDTTPPEIVNVSVDAGSSNVTITASVNEACLVSLSLSPTVPGTGTIAANESSPAVWSLGGLSSGTQYTYTLVATDPSGNQSTASSGSFTTDVAADTTPPAFTSQPSVSVTGLSATISWSLNEVATGTAFYRVQGSTGGYTTAASGTVNSAHVVSALLPFYETVYEYYVAGADVAGNAYQSDVFTFASGPDLTGPGGGLDPSQGDLVTGEKLTSVRVNVPDGLSVGDTFIAQATVPVARPSDLTPNWAVNGEVVQRHVNSYKPRAQASSARFVHQLIGGQITHPAGEVQALNNQIPTNWSITASTGVMTWSGGNLVDATTVTPIRYYSDLTEGTYELYLEGDAAYDVDEYFWVRVNGGAWTQAHGTSGTYGGYTDNTETARISFAVGADEVGEYLLEVAGGSANLDLEWIGLVPTGDTIQTTLTSERVSVTDPTGANSVEIIFPVEVPAALGTFVDPQSPSDGQYFDVDVVATDLDLPSGTAQDGREVDQMKLVMTMPKPARDAGYDELMDAVIAGGAGTTLKSGPYMDEVVYYTRLTDVSGNAGVGVHTYVRYFKADVDDSVYVDLNITNSHVDTTRIVSGMSENAYIGNPGKIFFDQLYLETNDVNYNIINGFGAETVTTPDALAMTVGDPYCGGPALGDDTTFFFVDYTDNPSVDLTRSHDGTGGIPARSEVFHAGAQRIEQVVLRPASSPVKSDLFATEVAQYQNVGRTIVSNTNRNAGQELRWWGGNYYRGGELPETYVAQSPFPATLTGSDAYDRMRMNNAAQAIKEVLSTGAIQANRDFFEQGGIIDWADMTQFGCWTPGGSVDGSSSKNHMLNVYETAAGPGHTRGWAFFARTVLQRHSITAFDSTGAPITIRHLYGTSAQAGATANESAIQVRNDRSGQAHGWSFFYERDEWVAGRFYSRGTQIRYNGQNLVCLTSHRDASPPVIGAFWAVGDENNTRANQREFNGSYPIVAEADIDAGAAYTPALTINCAYDTAWDQFTPISRDYIQRLYRCFLGLRLTVNPGIFNDYQRYQTELYLAAEDRFITQDVLNGGKTNDTLGHCLATFANGNSNRGFFHNDAFGDPGMQSDWGAGKAWAHWVIAQGMFFTPADEVYPAPVLGGDAYNRRQHIREHISGVRDLIAAVMPGETAGNITETYPVTAASRRSYLNTRDDVAGLEDTQVVGLSFTLITNGAPNIWTPETLRALVNSSEFGEVLLYKRLNPFERIGTVLAADEANGTDLTLWTYLDGTIEPTQGMVCVVTDASGTKLPQENGYLMQVSGQELDAREFSYAKSDDMHINAHMWQCMAETLQGYDLAAARDLFRLSVDHAQFDIENSGTIATPLNWFTAATVSGQVGSLVDWDGAIAGTSTTFAGGYYPGTADLVPTAKAQTSLAIPSSIIPHNTTRSDKRASRDGTPLNRIPAVTGGFVPAAASEWANLAWIAAHYSARRMPLPDPAGLLSPYLTKTYLRTGLGYELEENSPLVQYDANGTALNVSNSALLGAIVDPEERFAFKSRVLAGYFAKSQANEGWYNTSPIISEIDYLVRKEGADIGSIRLSYAGNPTGEAQVPLELTAESGQATTVFPVALTTNSVPVASTTTVLLSLEPDPEAPAQFPGSSRVDLVTDTVVIPANTGEFSSQLGLVLNSAAASLFGAPAQRGLLVAEASGGINESVSIPFTVEYPTLDPSVVRFDTPSATISSGQTVSVVVTRTNIQQPVSIALNSAGDDGFSISGLTNGRLTMSTGVASASFTVSYTQPTEGPGALTLTLQDDPNEPYTVDAFNSTHTITALVPIESGDSLVSVARIGGLDGAAGSSPAALGMETGDMTLVSATVPLMPAQAVVPSFSMALDSGTPYLADVFPVARDASGAINLVQVTCPVTADSDDKVRHSIPGDAANPAVVIRRYTVGDTLPGLAPDMAIQSIDLTNVSVVVTDSDGDEFTFSPDANNGTVIYEGQYTRQTEYVGTPTFSSDTLLNVRVIVTERADFPAAAVDVVVENSRLTCPVSITNEIAEAANEIADGTVYFESIKLIASDHVISAGVPHPSQGDDAGTYYLVKPFNDLHTTTGVHGMLPGHWFARRVVLAETAAAVEANVTASIANRDDWGYVEGSLGFVQGGFGPAQEGIPMFSNIAGLSYGGESGFRAVKERAEFDRAADIADFTGATLPAMTSSLGAGTQASYGWYKGVDYGASAKPFGVSFPSWRAANSLMVLVDRTIERSSFATFNTLTGYPVRDSEYRVGGQTPAAFNLFRSAALDINPWLWTSDTTSGTFWARAAASKQTEQGAPLLSNPGEDINWHANITDLTADTAPYNSEPFRGTDAARMTQAYIPAIYLLNDRVAKLLCEQDANRYMFGFGRYNQKGGGISTSRSPFGAAQATFGLHFLSEDLTSPYASGAVQSGILLRKSQNPPGTTVYLPSELPSAEAWGAPALAISAAYLVGDTATRQWIAPTDPTRNWFTLLTNVFDNVVCTTGVFGAKVTGYSSVPTTDLATLTGSLPGPQAGNGIITPVTAPTALAYQSLVSGDIDLTWEYPDTSVYPEPDQFVIVRNGADVTTVAGNLRTVSETGLSSQTEFTYEVRAEFDTSSATSAPLTEVYANGADGGPIQQPTYNGEEDLPAGYYVPETTFNYLIDLSGDTDTGTNVLKTAAAEFTDRLAQPTSSETHIRLNAEPTRIAVLLPVRNGIEFAKETDAVSVSRTGAPGDKAQFNALNSNVELHFVAPWAASVTDRASAASQSRGDTATYSYIYEAAAPTVNPQSGATSDIEFDGVYENAKHEIHLWNWDIRLANPMKLGRTVASSTLINQVSQQSDVYIHMSKITGGAGIDVELTRLQLEGVHIDLPTASSSAITMDAVPYGDMTWQRVDILNSGGAGIQVRNSNAVDAITGLRSRVQSGTPGTITFTQWYATQFSGDSPYAMFSFEGDHHAIEFGDHCNFAVPVSGTDSAPVLRVFNDDTADTIFGLANSSGGFCSGVSATGLDIGFFSEDPTGPVVQIDAAKTIQLGGRISVGTSATNDTVHIGTVGRGALASGTRIFDSLSFSVEPTGTTGNWLTTLGVTGITSITGEGGTNLFDLGILADNENAYQSFTGPSWDEAANDPYVPGGTFDALALYQAGTSRIAAKTAVVPSMKAGRAPRTVQTGGFNIFEWKVDAGSPAGVFLDLRGDASGFSTSPDRTVITYANWVNDGTSMNPGQQKVLYAEYSDRSQNEIINGEVVNSRQFYERPAGAKVVFDNIQVEDLSTRYYSPPYSYIDNGLNLDNATDVPRLAAGINATQTDIQLDDWTWRLVNTNADMFPYVCLAENKGSVQSTSQAQEIILVGSFDETNQRLLNCTRGVQFDNPVPEWGVLGGPAKSWPAATQVFGAPNPLNRSLKWGGRMNAIPNLHIKDCDFKTIHEEHTCYGNTEGPILIENTTFQNATAQGTQWVHRTTENPYAENHAYDPNEPPTREVRNTHFIDCGAYGTVTARKSSNLTFQDSGYPTLPCPYIKVTDCSFVTGIEAFEPVASEGDGGGGSGYRYRYNKDGGVYQSSGVIQFGVEGGWFRNPHHYNNVDMQPIAEARTDDSAAIHQLIELKNVYIHAMDPDKPVVRIQGGRNIIIEDTVIILEWREGGSAKPCLIIDSNMWKAVTERGTINHHYMFSQKLILRNSVIEIHDYRGGGSTPIITPGNIQFTNGFYLGDGYQQRLNSAQLDDYANTLGREVEFAGYYADGQQRTTSQVEVPIYDDDIRPGYMPT